MNAFEIENIIYRAPPIYYYHQSIRDEVYMSNTIKSTGKSGIRGKFNAGKFFIALAVTLGAGIIAGLFSMNAAQTYSTLILPSFSPPSWLFAPVWILLYILMGLALYRILMLPDQSEARLPILYFSIQLVFNLLWPLLFFTFGLRLAALADILILFFYVVLTIVKFYQVDKLAGLLLVPYALWVAFAALLNLWIVLLNG